MLLQAGGGQHREKSPLLRRMAGSGGGEEALSFPREGQDHKPEGATANHLENKHIVLRLKFLIP